MNNRLMRGAYMSQYVATALWSSVDVDDDTPLDETGLSLHPDTLQRMRDDLAAFLFRARRLLRQAARPPDDAAHDFWLTRCGHGAGFWDGDWPDDVSDELTKLAHDAGNVDLYIGDDGMIHS